MIQLILCSPGDGGCNACTAKVAEVKLKFVRTNLTQEIRLCVLCRRDLYEAIARGAKPGGK